MQQVKFIKSFSKGQITIPKEFRDSFGIGDDFWLKLSLEGEKMIAEPIKHPSLQKNYLSQLLQITGKGFSASEYALNRTQVEKRLQRHLQ